MVGGCTSEAVTLFKTGETQDRTYLRWLGIEIGLLQKKNYVRIALKFGIRGIPSLKV